MVKQDGRQGSVENPFQSVAAGPLAPLADEFAPHEVSRAIWRVEAPAARIGRGRSSTQRCSGAHFASISSAVLL
jgi:hypothetical protein